MRRVELLLTQLLARKPVEECDRDERVPVCPDRNLTVGAGAPT